MKTFKLMSVAVMLLFGTLTISLGAQAQADIVIFENGSFVDIPSNAQVCEYQEVYCPGGWLLDETGEAYFPGIEAFTNWVQRSYDLGRSDAVASGIVLDYPLCDDGLIVGPGSGTPCYELRLE